MAKETKKETAKEIVSVEMTQEQKQAFVDFQLKKEREATDKASDEGFVKMVLVNKHSFGRRTYGPGEATIPAGLAGQIAWTEQKANTRELELNSSNKRLIKILQNGQHVPVKVE